MTTESQGFHTSRPHYLNQLQNFRRLAAKILLLFLVGVSLSNVALQAQKPALSSEAPTLAPTFQQIAPGVEYLQLIRRSALKEEGAGPWAINVLRIDPRIASLKFARALDQGVGLETVSSLAARHGSIAATNAGYFRTTGVFRGESVGTFVQAGKLLSEPNNDRVAVGLIGSKGAFDLIFGHLKFEASIAIGAKTQFVNGFNRPLAPDEIVIFTPEFHRTTLTTPDGVEVIVRRDKVVTVNDRSGSNQIPGDGFVITADGRAREWLLANIRKGSTLKLTWKLTPAESHQAKSWSQALTITAGGPQLIKGGRISINSAQEKIAPAFVNDRHPRTAIAKLSSGQILLLTVDGRQPNVSVGMSLPGLAQLLLEFGATEAINLDGGGSTTMVVQNKVVNKPSDQSGERPVSDAILIFSRPK